MSIIGNGTVDHLEDFAEHHPRFERMFTDPKKATYKAMDMNRGFGGLSALKMVAGGLRASRDGHRQGRVAGDPLQQGGVVAVATDGTLLMAHRDSTGGDHLSPDELLRRLGAMPDGGRSN